MPKVGKNHGYVVTVSSVDALLIALRAAWLNNGGYARFGS